MRQSSADVMETLAKPIKLKLEAAMEFCSGDECVEVTPRTSASARCISMQPSALASVRVASLATRLLCSLSSVTT